MDSPFIFVEAVTIYYRPAIGIGFLYCALYSPTDCCFPHSLLWLAKNKPPEAYHFESQLPIHRNRTH